MMKKEKNLWTNPTILLKLEKMQTKFNLHLNELLKMKKRKIIQIHLMRNVFITVYGNLVRFFCLCVCILFQISYCFIKERKKAKYSRFKRTVFVLSQSNLLKRLQSIYILWKESTISVHLWFITIGIESARHLLNYIIVERKNKRLNFHVKRRRKKTKQSGKAHRHTKTTTSHSNRWLTKKNGFSNLFFLFVCHACVINWQALKTSTDLYVCARLNGAKFFKYINNIDTHESMFARTDIIRCAKN